MLHSHDCAADCSVAVSAATRQQTLARTRSALEHSGGGRLGVGEKLARERAASARAHRFVSVRTFVQSVCSLALAVVLFWVALRLCCFFAAGCCCSAKVQ